MSKFREKSLPSQSLARGLEILEFISFSRRAVRLKDVSEAFELDMASTHRILTTLEKMDYIARLPIGKSYGPGEKLKILSQSFRVADKLVDVLKPVIVELAESTGQVAHIAVLRENHTQLVEVILNQNAKISIQQAPGDVDELYCSAVGKSILACLPSFEQNALLRSMVFRKNTPNTIVKLSVLKRELKYIRKQLIAFDDREGEHEISCIGAPVFDETGYPVAAIGISMLADTLSGSIKQEEEKIGIVRSASQKASTLISSSDIFIL